MNIEKPSETMAVMVNAEYFRNLSSEDFLNLGMGQIAYIKPLKIMNQQAFALHGADGAPLNLMESFDAALMAARQNDLKPVVLH